ncbi:MAG TPA: MgtC/SapB family protein [Candidatus Binataceae bacterium]|nr:MgtC/SapB family protein [Candidatus Binataceae bacterium]
MILPGNYGLIARLAVALAIGLLIGLERGWERRELPEGQRAAGLRTFGLIGLLGGVTAQVGGSLHGIVMAVAAAAVSAFMALGYSREPWRGQDVSITGLVAALLTFCLGALAGAGETTVASSTAVVVALLLGFKPELHSILRRIERSELLATLRLLLISVVLLPVLPNAGFGPWQAFNPYRTWWMVVLVAAVSYVGYFAIRVFGERRGLLMTALCGGLVSSTAVTVSVARRANDQSARADLLAGAVAVATATMLPRILVVVGVVSLALARALAIPVLSAGLLTLAAAAWFSSRSATATESERGDEPSNPLDLRLALKFGLFLAVTMILAQGANQELGYKGIYILAILAGLVDVDAINLSCASMVSQGQLPIGAAADAVLLAAATNTLLKPLIAVSVGNVRLGWRVIATVGAAFAGGAAGLLLLAR